VKERCEKKAVLIHHMIDQSLKRFVKYLRRENRIQKLLSAKVRTTVQRREFLRTGAG
jgi:hypothetical protein